MRNVWIWVSAALGVVCIGLLVWALSLKSDRDDAQQQVTQLQAQVDQAAQAAQGGGNVKKALKGAYDSLAQQIGATQQGVDANQQAIENAKTAVEQAQQDAQAAAQKAKDSASSAAEKTKARIDEAEANLKAAQGKAQLTADCAKSYLGAIGTLLDGDSITSQLQSVRSQLQTITADCKAALSGG